MGTLPVVFSQYLIMATNKAGVLVQFDEGQHNTSIQQEREGSYVPFTDALIVRNWEFGEIRIALLAFSQSTIDYIALAKRTKLAVTSKYRIEFYAMVKLQSIALGSLELQLGFPIGHLRQYFITASRSTRSQISDAAWQSLIGAIKEQRPKLLSDIDRLISLSRYTGYSLTGPTAEILLQEREALGIALDIFSGDNKLRERILREWAPDEKSLEDVNEEDSTARLRNVGERGSFLSGIPQRFIQEESAIQHDLFNWQDAPPIHQAGRSVFIQGNRRLEVIYANRNSLERTLGVDLIYYTEKYHSFVLVQYKLMHKEDDRMVYRPDSQLADELARMDSVCEPCEKTTAVESHQQFRLNHDGFMFKLVPNQGLFPASGELIKGMYLLREYMRFLLGQHGPKGPMGGSLITFDKAPRYLTNSDFCAGVNSGWFGTSGVQTRKLQEVVRKFYETGHALVVAHESLTG